MALSLVSAVTNLLLNDYAAVIVITSVGYDYVLTFPREIKYIWNKPWTLVSALFVLVRYLGICSFIMVSLRETSFQHGPTESGDLEQLMPIGSCGILSIVDRWVNLLFICAADLMMILRVWAMYAGSKIIFGMLITSYLAEVIPSTIASIIYSNPSSFSVTLTQIADFTFCSKDIDTFSWNGVSSITQLIHATVVCTLVITRFVKELLQMYGITKRWRLSQFINLLVMEGVLYFLLVLVWNLLNTMYAFSNYSPEGWQIIPVSLIGHIPLPTLTPRFILDIRELYAHNVSGSGSGIDSGFGLSTPSGSELSQSRIVFADCGQNEGEDSGEDIPMNERTLV